MRLPDFQLHRPASLEEALALLADLGANDKHRAGAVRLLAGGTDLVVNLRHHVETPDHVISLAALPELRGVHVDDSGALSIGASTTLGELLASELISSRYQVLAEAARHVSAPTLRDMGTVGGNICLDTRCHWYNQSWDWRAACGFCLKKDGDVCWVARSSRVCVAAYSGDIAPALLTLGAVIDLVGPRGERSIPLDEFFRDDGARPNVLEPDEILWRIRVPATRADLAGSYQKLRPRGSLDYSLGSLALAGRRDTAGTLDDVSIALTAVGPRPILVPDVDALLHDDAGTLDGLAERVSRCAHPLKTAHHFSPWYRKFRIGLFARTAVEQLTRRQV